MFVSHRRNSDIFRETLNFRKTAIQSKWLILVTKVHEASCYDAFDALHFKLLKKVTSAA